MNFPANYSDLFSIFPMAKYLRLPAGFIKIKKQRNEF